MGNINRVSGPDVRLSQNVGGLVVSLSVRVQPEALKAHPELGELLMKSGAASAEAELALVRQVRQSLAGTLDSIHAASMQGVAAVADALAPKAAESVVADA